jgi:hypothetical protein
MVLMAFQVNISDIFQEDLWCIQHIYIITVFGLVTSRHLAKDKNHNSAETRQIFKIYPKLTFDHPLVRYGQSN